MLPHARRLVLPAAVALLSACKEDAAAPPPAVTYVADLVRVDEEPAGANCAAGGVALRSGRDDDASGTLEDAEVDAVRYLCATEVEVPAVLTGTPLARFTAAPRNFTIALAWAHAEAGARVVVRRSPDTYPVSPSAGQPVYDGTATAVVDASGLSLGRQYFYSAFREDADGTFSPAATATAWMQRGGELDRTFAGSGFTSVPLAGDIYRTDVYDVSLDAQGRVLAVGAGQGQFPPAPKFVWRFLPSGELDTGFAGTGFARVGNVLGTGGDRLLAVAADAQGRVVLTGYSDADTTSDGTNHQLFVMRLTEQGLLDTRWHPTGVQALLDLGGANTNDEGRALAFDAEGRLLVLGVAGGNQVVVARFLEDGRRDPDFGTGGAGYVLLPGLHSNALPTAIAVDGAGRIVTLEYGNGPTGTQDAGLRRLLPTGAPDPSFGGGTGLVRIHSPLAPANTTIFMSANDLALDAQDRPLVVGEIRSTDAARGQDMYALRLTPAGALDGTFGAGGVFVDDRNGTGARRDAAFACALDAQGRLVVSGLSDGNWGDSDVVVWRLTSAGALDPTFNAGAPVRLQDPALGNGFDSASSLALDAEGRYVLGGNSASGGGPVGMLWRMVP